MGRTLRCGRYPTLGEVLAYYSRDDFLDFLLRTCEVRRVILVLPQQGHWERNHERDAIAAGSRAELRDLVRGRILSEHAGVPAEARLPFYPSFHQSLERWAPGQVGSGETAGRDTVLEADLPNWRSSFQDVMTLVDVLREEGVPHLLKFSGHRSLHVVVPSAGMALHAGVFGESRAHATAILRMPYSLNEDTGLVSLPLKADELPRFRPWQANLHLVEIRHHWLTAPTPDERAQVKAFVTASRKRAPVPRRRTAEPVEVLDELRDSAARLGRRALPACPLWSRLLGGEPLTGAQLMQALGSDDAETRWLMAEAFLLTGTDLPHDAVARLLVDGDSYVRAAAVDILARFADTAEAYFAERMQAEEMGSEVSALSILAQSAVLRERVIAGLRAEPTRRGPFVTRLACVTGVVLDDWPAAWEMVRAAEEQGETGPQWEVRVEALRLMGEIAQDQWGPGPGLGHVQAMAEMGRAITDLLLLAMGTPNRYRRRSFLIPLCLVADERALEVYIEALADTYRDNPRWATRALLALGEKAVPALLEAAASDEARLRRYAIRCLGHLGDPRGRDTVLRALNDSDEAVRRQAVLASRHYAGPSDVPVLKEVMRHSRAETRQEALKVLLSLGEAGGEAVVDLALHEGEPTAAGWLWQEGDGRGREAVLAAARGEGSGWEAAVIELARRPVDHETLPALVRALPRAEWATQEAVAQALVDSGKPEALAALLALARSDDMVDRKVAAAALGRWDEPEAVARLVNLLVDPRRSVRQKAVEVLLSVGERAREALEAARQDHRLARAREYIASILNGLEVRRKLAAGERLDLTFARLVAHSQARVWDDVAEHVSEQGSEEEIEALLSACVNGSAPESWFATVTLGRLGPRVRGMVEDLLTRTGDDRGRARLLRVLEQMVREGEEQVD